MGIGLLTLTYLSVARNVSYMKRNCTPTCVCCFVFSVSGMTYHRVCNKGNTPGVTCEVQWVRVSRSLFSV